MSGRHPATAARCHVGRRQTHDLDLVVVSNDQLALTFAPSVGGRLISCRFRGVEVLWHDPGLLDEDLRLSAPRSGWAVPDGTMASWTNLGGSKTWPAPQGWDHAEQWHGPPDPVLDAGSYALVVEVDDAGTAVVDLTSGVDPVTGVQITRTFRLPGVGAGFEQVSTFHNRTDRPITWSVWDVTQVDADPAHGADGVVVVQGRDAGPVEHLFAVEGDLAYTREAGAWTVPSQDAVGKLGFPTASGTLEWYRRDGLVLTLSTERRPGTYPDGGCPVELWLQHPLPGPVPALGGLEVTAHLVELELLSPLTTLRPGEAVDLATSWRFSGAVATPG